MNSALPRPSTQLRAYFAGYFDAEGTLAIIARNKGQLWNAQIRFGQTNDVVLKMLHATYGGTLHTTKRARANGRPQTRWVLSRFGAIACFLDDLLPFLGEKRAQAEQLLTRFSTRMLARDAHQLIADLDALKSVELTAKSLPESVRARSAHRRRRCVTVGCRRPHRARGYCASCYQRARYGDVLGVSRARTDARVFSRLAVPLTELAYFAGYFDGDGSVALRRGATNTWRLSVAFNQTRADALLRLMQAYGGSLRFRPRAAPRRNQLSWRLTQRVAVETFLRDIAPYVVEKRAVVTMLCERFSPTMTTAAGEALVEDLRCDRPTRNRAPKALTYSRLDTTLMIP